MHSAGQPFFSADLAASTLVLSAPSTWPHLMAELFSAVHAADRWQSDSEKPLTIVQVRELHRFAEQTPVGAQKVAIVFLADQLKAETANALLKLLEEPPAYLRVVLLAESKRLLPTVLSRVRLLNLHQPKDGDTDLQQWQQLLASFTLSDQHEQQQARELLYLLPLMHSTVQQTAVREAFTPPNH